MVQIIIPMSGLGERFVNAGYNAPKPLIEVDGKPMIEHVVNLFPGETNVSFICNDKHLNDEVGPNMRATLQRICPMGKIYEVPVEGREGPVHAVSLIFDHIEDEAEVIVSYCDYGTAWNYEEFLKDTRARGAAGAVACYRGFHPHMLGTDNYAFLKETGVGSRWMAAIQEKQPFTPDRMTEYASNGTYYFKSGAILKKYFKQAMEMGEAMKVRGEYYVSMVYNLLVADGLGVSIFEIDHMLQWGTPYDLEVYKGWSRYFRNILTPQENPADTFETTLILPMAGAGSRFTKKGYTVSKPLIKVNGKPMIVQAVDCLPATTQKVFICLEEHLKTYNVGTELKKTYEGCQIETLAEITQGQACTSEIGIRQSKVRLDKPILISACDNGVYYDKAKYQKLLDDETIDVIVWTFRNNPTSRNNPHMYAWLETDDCGYVKKVSCKKFIEGVHDIRQSHVIIGTMFFRKASYFLEGLAENYKQNIRSNGEYYVDDVIQQNITQGGLRVKVFEVENYICWGTPDDYETYCYWQRFFHQCAWHPYAIEKDNTFG